MNEMISFHKNITMISVGHRPTLKKFHNYTLRLGVGYDGTGYSFGETKQDEDSL